MMDEKSRIESSGQQELTQAKKNVKNAYRQLRAMKDEELQQVLEVIYDKDLILERKDVKFDVEVDENRRLNTYHLRGDPSKDKNILTDPEIDDYWMTGFSPNETYVKFKFE